MQPEGVILGVLEGCKGPLETAYQEKVPKIDFDALANKYGALDPASNRVIEIHGGETLHMVPTSTPTTAPPVSGGLIPIGKLVPLVYLGSP